MSGRRDSNRGDMGESIRQALGKHVKILHKVPMKLEKGGGDRTDNRVLVFTPHRLFVMTAKFVQTLQVPTKIDHHFHYLDIQAIESKKPNQVVFKIHDKSYSFRPSVEVVPPTSDIVDVIILTVARAIRSIFPGVLLSQVVPKVEVVPVTRIKPVLEMKPLDFKDMGPCGGFSTQYACYCDYYNLPYREEVAWDVDTIYFSHDSHELCLTDFEHLEQRDLICIISALEHNTWFTKLRASANTAKLAGDVVDKILAVVAKSPSLQELHLSSAGVRWEFFQRLAGAMGSNQYCNLNTLDISLNFVEDRGLISIANVLAHFPRGTRHINLAHCTLTGKGVNNLCQSLITNKLSLNSLTYLNLAGNCLKEEVTSLVNFLAQPNVVSILDLSSTEVPSELLFGALVRGCTTHLSHLNLARNPFCARKSKGDIPPTFKQFFATTLGLKYLNLSHGKLPLEALKALLLGLACNEATGDVELNISTNCLGAGGAAVMEHALPGVSCVSRLDVSDNLLDAELASVVQGVTRMRSLLSLNISKNLPKIKAKEVGHVMEAIVNLIQEEESSLQKLNLSDCKLKTDINNVINALGSNQCLQVLDISGNGMGDVGARLLAKALQINTRLRTVLLDRNGISLQGYQDITYALQCNRSMRHIPFPTYDLQPAMKTSPERVDAIIRRMQDSLQRNSNPSQGGRSNAFRLTQGFLQSSTQQVLDRWSAQVQDCVHNVKREHVQHQVTEVLEEVELAEGYVKEAEKCKLLLSSLHETTAQREEPTPMNSYLATLCESLQEFLTQHLATSVNSMLATAQELCPQSLAPGSPALGELHLLTATKARLPQDFVKNLVTDGLGVELNNKVNEMNLILANHISDKVIDDVIDNLSRSYKGMVGDPGSLQKKRSRTPDVLKGSCQRLDGSSEGESLSLAGDNYSQQSNPSPLSTPATSKRKSIHDRKLRPKSVVDVDGPDYCPDLLTHTSRTDLEQSIEEEDSVPELPEIPALQHLAKARPKRPKKHAATRGVTKAQTAEADSEDIKEGLDNFFSKSVTSSLASSITSSTASPEPQRTPTASPIASTPLQTTGRASPLDRDSASPLPPSSVVEAKNRSIILKQEDFVKKKEEPVKKKEEEKKMEKTSSRSGLSCLRPNTLDEDTEAFTRSPERREATLSPGGRSISDIFGKQVQDKLKGRSDRAPPGTSPFTARRSETEVFTSKRRSFFQTSEGGSIPSPSSVAPLAGEDNSPEEEGEDGVTRRSKGQGLGADMLKEIRVKQEKRASVIPLPRESGESKAEGKEEENPFGAIKLRSTGRASTLTSPTSDFSPDLAKNFPSSNDTSREEKEQKEEKEEAIYQAPEKIKHSSSSIIGLRVAVNPPTTSKSRNDLATPTSGGAGDQEEVSPKPRPPPKPRPWSLVGVDRKSGEYTSVEGGGVTPPQPDQGEVEEEEEEGDDEKGSGASEGRRGSLVTKERGSVRDMIASLNKPEKEGVGGTVGGLLGAGSVRDRIASMNKGDPADSKPRKGNSLPRNTEGLSTSAKSPGLKAKNSPKNLRKESDTASDPRILKLDDDFMYEDSGNV